MLDPAFVRENPDAVAEALRNRGMGTSLEPIQRRDKRRRELLVEVEDLRRQRKEASKSIGARIKAGEDPAVAKDEVRQIGDRITALEEELHRPLAVARGRHQRVAQVAPAPERRVARDVGDEVGVGHAVARDDLLPVAPGEDRVDTASPKPRRRVRRIEVRRIGPAGGFIMATGNQGANHV